MIIAGDDEKTYIHYLALDMFEDHDTDKNNELSYEEYDALKAKERDNISKFTKEENDEGMVTISFGGPSDDETAERKAKDDKDYKESDADNNGSLDLKEFEIYLKTKGEALA